MASIGIPVPNKVECKRCKYAYDSVRDGYVCLFSFELALQYGLFSLKGCKWIFPESDNI